MTADAEAPVATRVLALDIGTSSVRARLYDRGGVETDPGPDATRRYTWDLSGGGMFLPAEELFGHVAGVLDAAATRAREDGLQIVAVAVAAFWHGILGVDASGAPLTPVFGWADQRGVRQALRLRAQGDERSIHARTGCFLHPSYPSVRLAWLRDGEPELYARVASWISFPEYLEERLFGTRRCSVSIASGTGLLDVHRLEWDGEWLAALGLTPAHLSPVVDAGVPLSGMLPEHARRWPELRDAEWHPALGDGACANVGSGAIGRSDPGLTIGTSAAIRSVWEAESAEVPAGLWCYRLDGRRWVAGRALSNGGNGLAYLRRDLLAPGPDTPREAAALPPDAHGLTVLPFLLRERGPGWRAEADAAIVGMKHSTTPAHVIRAWMEAVAYRLAEAAGQLESALGPARRVWASGGGIHASPFWAGILADVLDRPVFRPRGRETTARGAALASMERLGWIAELSEAPEPEIAEVVEPDPVRHAAYIAGARRQRDLESAIAAWRSDD